MELMSSSRKILQFAHANDILGVRRRGIVSRSMSGVEATTQVAGARVAIHSILCAMRALDAVDP
jgi:hypothetical protein